MHPQDKSGGDSRAPSLPKFVPLILSDEHREALRDDCMNGLQAILADLKTPTRLRDPIANAVEAEMFRRLLEALDTEQIQVPDEEMRERMGRLAASYDEMENVEEVMNFHDAHELLLGILDGSREDGEGANVPGPRWTEGDDEDCRREVLGLLIDESPQWLEFDDVAVALAGDPEDLSQRNALKDAVSILASGGLVTRRGGTLAPSRAARQMAGLGYSIG